MIESKPGPRERGHACETEQSDHESVEANVRKALDVRFRRHAQNPLMQLVRALAEKHLISAQKGKGGLRR